jgi:hypothetical protein
MRTLARLKQVIDPFDLAIGQPVHARGHTQPVRGGVQPRKLEQWSCRTGEQNAHILLVTLNKQGKTEDHRYADYWIDENTFHWQSQNATPSSKRGREIIEHKKDGRKIHLFVRKTNSRGKPRRFCTLARIT